MSPRFLIPLSLFLCLALPSNSARSAGPDVQAHGSAERLWLARVQPQPGAGEVTTLFVRAKSDPTWQRLEPVGSRVLGLASRGSQLALLLPDGNWLLMTDSGPTSGRPLPGNANLIALGSDAASLWAVGLANGDGSAGGRTSSSPATRPATAPASVPTRDSIPTDVETLAPSAPPTTTATTSPAASRPTAGTTGPPGTPTTARSGGGSGGSRLALYRLGGPLGWEEQGPLPQEIPAAEGVSVSLAVVGGRPVVAHKATGRSARVFRRADGGTWDLIGDVATPDDLGDYKVLEGTSGAVLWLSGAAGPERLWIWRGPGGGEPISKTLGPQGGDGRTGRAIAAANGALRLLWVEGERIHEQRLNPDTGEPAGAPAAMPVPAVSIMPTVQRWANVVLMGALIFAMAASIRRRREMGGVEPDPATLPLAPFSRRLLAGAIDVMPAALAGLVVWLRPGRGTNSAELDRLVTALVACGVYLALTTAVELVAGRSIGKLVTGLRVVGLDGKPAGAGARLVRNLLRVIDLPLMPLLLVVFSPLRQRAGDFAAGTLVIRGEAAAEEGAGGGTAREGGGSGSREDDSMTKPE